MKVRNNQVVFEITPEIVTFFLLNNPEANITMSACDNIFLKTNKKTTYLMVTIVKLKYEESANIDISTLFIP